MSESSERIDALADRLLESDAVDWAAELESAGPDEQELILALRDIARVAEVNRTFEQALDSNRPTVPRTPSSVQENLPKRWGHLEILEKVGAGASATVYRARDPHLNREAALKLFHFARPASPEIKQALMEEGRNLAQVKHNNVVTIYGADEQEGRVALWMEFVQGQTIHELVAKQGTLSADEATAVGVELCRALAAVHARDLVHGDIKAQNVMREAGGRIVLMDFSTSRAAAATEGPKGRFVGTPLYMAPELFTGESVSNQSDVYSLGVLLFYMATGKYPVKAETAEELREAHKKSEQVLLSDVRPDLPDDFVAAVEKALARDPGDRFQSAGALKAALMKGAGLAATASGVKRVTNWAGILALVGATLLFLGWVTSMTFNAALHIPPEFVSDSALDYFVLGLQSMIPAVWYMSGALAPIVIMLTTFILVKGWKLNDARSRLNRKQRELFDRVDAMSVAAGYVLVIVVAVVGLTWYYNDLLGAIEGMYAASSVTEVDITALGLDFAGYQIMRKRLYSFLLLAIVLGAIVTLPYLRERLGPSAMRWMQAATVAIILVTTVIMVIPYRLLWHNESERVDFEGHKAFIVAENPPDLLLYIPTAPGQSHSVVDENDPRIQRGPSRVVGDIFAE